MNASRPQSSKSALDREVILRAFATLSEGFAARGVTGELCLFGGTVILLAFNARVLTKDVDALFQPTSRIRDLASRIAADENLPANWLNDGVKGYLSGRYEVIPELCRSFLICARPCQSPNTSLP